MAFLLPLVEAAAPFLISSLASPLLTNIGQRVTNAVTGEGNEEGGGRNKHINNAIHHLNMQGLGGIHHTLVGPHRNKHILMGGMRKKPYNCETNSRARRYGGQVGPTPSAVGDGISGPTTQTTINNTGPLP
jgi:hypothetical protein